MMKLNFLSIILSLLLISCSSSDSGGEVVNPSDPEDEKIWASATKYHTYENDGLIMNAADPGVFKDDDGTYYLYHTGKGFKVHSSKDLVNWTNHGQSMPSYKWAVDKFWAPEGFKYKGKYYITYTGAPQGKPKHIGLAVSSSPTGPFVDINDEPFHGHTDSAKEILDSHFMFDDDGRAYLYYNNDMSTNVVNGQKYSELMVVEIEPDLSATIGTPIFIGKPEQSWEYNTTGVNFWNEGAWVIRRDDIYYLMYSANNYGTKRYSVGYATSSSPFGPFAKYENNPILSYEPYMSAVSGTGHHSVVYSPDDDEMIIIYHSHMDIAVGGGNRMVNIDRMGFRADGTMYVCGPTVTEQLKPSYNSQSFRSVEADAVITCDETKGSITTAALSDGEFSMYERFKEYEWVANFSDNRVLVSYEWGSEQKIEEIWIYNSIETSRQATAVNIEFGDGTTVEGVILNKRPGEATVISLNNTIDTNVIKFSLITADGRDELSLSEIKILASKM